MLSILLAILISAVTPSTLSSPTLPGSILNLAEEGRNLYSYGREFLNPNRYAGYFNTGGGPESVFIPGQQNPFSYPYASYSPYARSQNPSLAIFDGIKEAIGYSQKRIRSPQLPYMNEVNRVIPQNYPFYWQSYYYEQPVIDAPQQLNFSNLDSYQKNITGVIANNNTLNQSLPLEKERESQNSSIENIQTSDDPLKKSYIINHPSDVHSNRPSGYGHQYRRLNPWDISLDSSKSNYASPGELQPNNFLPSNQRDIQYNNNIPLGFKASSYALSSPFRSNIVSTYTGGRMLSDSRYMTADGRILPATVTDVSPVNYVSTGTRIISPSYNIVPTGSIVTSEVNSVPGSTSFITPAINIYQRPPYIEPQITRFRSSDSISPYTVLGTPNQSITFTNPADKNSYYIVNPSVYSGYRAADDPILGILPVLPIIKPRTKLVTFGSIVKTDEGNKFNKYDNKEFNTGFFTRTPTGNIYSQLHTNRGTNFENFNKKSSFNTLSGISHSPLASAGV